eukprot:GHVS01062503.1.p1 GENE.GHVS01062503.1~~GHVS01062503.1.p1  ORF type:complete len:465 (+),score=73.92 GHVS01062503.1:44-1438(+)
MMQSSSLPSNVLFRLASSSSFPPRLRCCSSFLLSPFRPPLPFFSTKQSSSFFCSSTSPSSASSAATFNVYHAGLLTTEFSNTLNVDKTSPVIPIFRVLSQEGTMEGDWEAPFPDQEVVDLYQFMVRLSVWDDMMYNIQRQGRISFYIQNQGEEAVQTGVGRAVTVMDTLWCQYRELGVLMSRGFTLDDALAQCFSTKDDEGKGRQMPISYTKKNLNLQTICTPLTTQVPHAAGAGYAFKLAGEKRCSIAFFGEGAASEGDFHAAMNFASVLKSQTLFMCRNNGYAISTPVKDQYAGDGIAIRGVSYGMHTVRVDGNDLFAVYLATKKCREICVNESVPVCMEFMTYRMGHHSTSDDSSQYRPKGEYDSWSEAGLHPIARVRKYLEQLNLWDKEKDEELRAEAKKVMLTKLKEVEKVKKYKVIPGMFDDVYAENTWHIEQQRAQFREHLTKHKDKYDFSAFESLE